MRITRPIHAGATLIVAFAAITASCAHHAKRASIAPPPARIKKTEVGVASWYGTPYHGRQTASGEIYDMYKLTAAHRNLPFQTWVEVENLSNGKRVDVRINDRGPFVGHRVIDLSQTAAQEIDMLGVGTARVRLTVVARPTNNSPAMSSPATAPPTTIPPTTISPPVISATTISPATAPAVSETLETESAMAPPARPPSFGASSATPARASADAPTKITSMPRFVVQAGAFADRDRAEALRMTMTEAFAEARTLVDPSRNPPLWKVLVGREMTREQAAELALRVRRQTGAAIVVPEVAGPIPETEAIVP